MATQTQEARIKKILEEELKELRSLPEDQARERARESLIRIGILNSSGKVNKNYARGFVNAQ